MRFALVFVFCTALFLVVESFGDQESDDRHGLRKCKKKCKVGECCRMFWYWYRCFPQRGLGQPCRRKPPAKGTCTVNIPDTVGEITVINSLGTVKSGQKQAITDYLCHHGCKEGLVCKRSRRPRPTGGRHPHHDRKRFKCVRPSPPTQEPGSGDIDF